MEVPSEYSQSKVSNTQEELIAKLLEIAKTISNTKEQLFKKYVSWHKEIWNIILTLLEIRDKLKTHSFRSNCANLSGASATILGSVASIVGIALMPVTAGISLSLTIGGAVTASAGGVVSVGSTITNHILSKQLCERVNDIFDKHISFTEEVEELANEYSETLEEFQNLLDQLEQEYSEILKIFLHDCMKCLNDSKSIDDWCPTVSKIEEMRTNNESLMKSPLVCEFIIQLIKYVMKDSNMVNMVKNIPMKNIGNVIGGFGVIPETAVSGGRIAKTVSEAGRLFMFYLKEAGMAIRVGLSILNAVFLIWGLVDLVKTSVDIHRGSETNQTKEISKVVRKLKQFRKETKRNAIEIFGNELIAALDD